MNPTPRPQTAALVLTSAPGTHCLDDRLVTAIAAGIGPQQQPSARWLAGGEAWELQLVGVPVDMQAKLLAGALQRLGRRPVDINLIPGDAVSRRKRLLVADMDSTIIEQECIDEMADMMGLKPRIAAITERAMRGELDFEAALAERVALLAGLTEADLARVSEERITLMPGARTLIATMRARGAFTALVSGGFTYFTSRVRARAGFDFDRANTLGLEGGRLTGSVLPPIIGREAKLATLTRIAGERSLQSHETLAVGDGANDLAMIKAAGLGVAYRAKPIVAAQAGARITHGDLTALLYLQGYRRDEFATA